MTITYIVVWNDRSVLDNMLIRSFNKLTSSENVKRNLRLIDNSDYKYSSCAQAYNANLKDVCSDILIFCHQDIDLDDDKLQKRIICELIDNPNQILGVAGMTKEGKTVSNLKYRKTGKYITATQITEKTEVYSLDECCFAMTKDMYLKLKFDEYTCSHWHLYAVDFCYEAKRKYGIKSYVLPESIYHKMDGSSGLSTDRYFLWTIFKMTRKYHREFQRIYTPCYIVSTFWPKTILKLSRSLLKNIF